MIDVDAVSARVFELALQEFARTGPGRSSVSDVVKLERHDAIAIVTVDSPPVNALSAAVRGGIQNCINLAIADSEVKEIVLTCAGRTFIAVADTTELGKPPVAPER